MSYHEVQPGQIEAAMLAPTGFANQGRRVTDSDHFLVVDPEGLRQDRFPRGNARQLRLGQCQASDLKTGEFQTFVRPVRHPVLTQYCRDLTSISQLDVESASGSLRLFRRFAH